VPFLGAGISIPAQSQSNTENIKPTVDWMIEQLAKKLSPILYGKQKKIDRLQTALTQKDSNSSKTSVSKQDLQTLVASRLGYFCNAIIIHNLLTHEEIVDCIKIKQFSKLTPTRAHYFIAFLVRENLINEAITTNYDCCLERAVYHTHADEGNGKPEDSTSSPHPAVAIYSLRTYRKYASRRLLPFNQGTVLRVYKINGCAGELDRNPDHYRNILLTDRQLKHMDDRKWAKDLLRDRVRSRALIFSGFGSDEPQVNNIVDRLLEEFKETDPGNTDSIWIQAYERYPTLTQEGFLKDVWKWTKDDGGEDNWKKNLFSGEYKKSLLDYCGKKTGPDDKPKLEADLFWQTLFQLVFLALFERYSSPGSAGHVFLEQFDNPPRPIKRKSTLQQWLDPYNLGSKILTETGITKVEKNKPQPLERINQLIGYQTDTNQPWAPRVGIPLCLWLRALYCKKLPDKTGGEFFYLPLLHHMKIILSLLSLCCFSKSKNSDERLFPFSVKFVKDTPFLYFGETNRILLLAKSCRKDIERATEKSNRINIFVGIHSSNVHYRSTKWEPFLFLVEKESTIQIKRITELPITDIIATLLEKNNEVPVSYEMESKLRIRHVKKTFLKQPHLARVNEVSNNERT